MTKISTLELALNTLYNNVIATQQEAEQPVMSDDYSALTVSGSTNDSDCGATFPQGDFKPLESLIALPQGASKGDAVQIASKTTPLNEFGLPVFYYRSDMIDHTRGFLSQSELDMAAQGLSYTEGYPTTDQGSPFWNQLPHEPFEAHVIFDRFLEQAEDIGIRQIGILAGTEKKSVNVLNEWAKEFYWSARARAHDLFIVAAEDVRRQHRVRKMENKHFTTADDLMGQLMARFEGDEGEEWFRELSASQALEALEMLVKIQRLSVGLTGQHASSAVGAAPKGANLSFVMRSMTKSFGTQDQGVSGFDQQMATLLADPVYGMQIQDLIIRANS